MDYIEELKCCKLCPHECGINRIDGKTGRCKAGEKVKIALANLHYFEEPCISGEKGSGTVFFSGCNLSCKFCQNYKISQEYLGREITIEELADEIYSSTHSGLLQGNFVYALRCQEFPRLVITQRLDTGDFMVGQVMPGWTGYYPRVPYQFLFSDILEDMKKLKLPKETIDNFILVLKNYENFSN
jgi:hypothetical protein